MNNEPLRLPGNDPFSPRLLGGELLRAGDDDPSDIDELLFNDDTEILDCVVSITFAAVDEMQLAGSAGGGTNFFCCDTSIPLAGRAFNRSLISLASAMLEEWQVQQICTRPRCKK